MRNSKAFILVFGLLTVLSAIAALAIYVLSSAHGHGMPSTDRHVMQFLIVVSVSSAVATAWSLRC